ncbi:MAG: YihA family ribosome biogenesis GTP-binding protein [Firmicutes bacterium]|nr:ribosome biogenesis GTP-binding protein YihA/YsxC [Bacillota bacterium]NLO66587.1 YihA family ribosome biogenesis GTP-binding protein [Bacillota bacterium]
MNVHDAEFLTSAVNPQGYPAHDLPEVALVGRSNVGKSSLINTLVNRRKFARVSNQPGRTQTLNFYRVQNICLVDLPGYGYARVSAGTLRQWQAMIEGYLTERPNLVGIIQVVDVRHPPTADDRQMNEWLRAMDMPYVLVATKADKISRGRHLQHAKVIRETLGVDPILFSAQTKQGRDQVLRLVWELASGRLG